MSTRDSVETRTAPGGKLRAAMVVSWAWVAVPFVYGVYELVLKAKNLFGN